MIEVEKKVKTSFIFTYKGEVTWRETDNGKVAMFEIDYMEAFYLYDELRKHLVIQVPMDVPRAPVVEDDGDIPF